MNRRDFLRSTAGLAALGGSGWLAGCASTSEPVLPPLPRRSGRAIVVGAGMSGLSAATHLQRAGMEVVVLEARDRIGGRIHTDRSWGTPVDLGAGWIHGEKGSPLPALAD